MTDTSNVSILGTPVAALTRDEAVARILGFAAAGDRAYAVEAADTHVITRARHEADFANAIRRFDLICPDGMPLVWHINRSGVATLKERVSGAELMLETIRKSGSEPGLGGHFFLGGSEALLSDLEREIIAKAGEAKIAGYYSPPFGKWPEDEFERICGKIRSSGAVFVWVGLGCPKQETWIGANLAQLPPAVYFGIGAAFAFHAGHVQRAPQWMQNAGLEWFYRVIREPRRLFKRYFKWNSLFAWYSLRAAFSKR